MANQIKVFAYGDQNGSYATGTYKVVGVPSQGVVIAPYSGTQAGATINSQITVLPTGLVVNGRVYYSDATPAALITLGA